MLLVLDNFEHLLTATPLVAMLLEHCPGLVVLATSREALRLRAEQRFRVAPLAVPLATRAPTAATVANYDAVRFFLARARAGRPEFALTDENAAAVVHICRSLDGLPLALELAAARIAFLPPEALAARLDRPLTLRVRGARDLPARQQTLRAALDWSCDLLTPAERALFVRLGIFSGGWTVAAATEASGGEEPFEGLASLAEKSLIRPVEGVTGEPRFAMLTTIREYALEQLVARGEAEAVARAHARYYLALAEEAEPQFRGPDEGARLASLDAERDNLRAALDWYATDDAEAGLRLAAALWQFWWSRGHLEEGRNWLGRFLGNAPDDAPARPRALLGAGFLAMQQSDWPAARTHLEAGLVLSRARGDAPLTARLLRELGSLLAYFSEYAAARPLLEEALAIGRALDDPTSLEESSLNLARILRSQGDSAAAHALLTEARDAALARRATRSIAAIRAALGDTLRDEGDLAGTAREYAAALMAAREVGHTGYTAWSLAGLGQVALWQGDPARAETLLAEAVGLYDELGNAHSVGFVTHMRGQAARVAGDLGRAEMLLREAVSLRWRLGGQAGTAASLEALALIAASRGEALHAVRLLATAATARTAVGAPAPPLEQAALDEATATLRATFGGEAFVAAWDEAAMVPLEQVVQAVLAEPASPGDRSPARR
jgi:predicted ATPase